MLKGSGWSLRSIDRILLRIIRYKPLKLSSSIHLSKILQNKKWLVNPENKNCYFFKWTLLARCITGLNIKRVNSRYFNLESKFAFEDVDFPIIIN